MEPIQLEIHRNNGHQLIPTNHEIRGATCRSAYPAANNNTNNLIVYGNQLFFTQITMFVVVRVRVHA